MQRKYDTHTHTHFNNWVQISFHLWFLYFQSKRNPSLCLLPPLPPCICSHISPTLHFVLHHFSLFLHSFMFPSLSLLWFHLSFALKAKQHAHARTHTAEECRNDYAAQLQKYNKEQNFFYYTEIPQIFNVRQRHTFTMQYNWAELTHLFMWRYTSQTHHFKM